MSSGSVSSGAIAHSMCAECGSSVTRTYPNSQNRSRCTDTSSLISRYSMEWLRQSRTTNAQMDAHRWASVCDFNDNRRPLSPDRVLYTGARTVVFSCEGVCVRTIHTARNSMDENDYFIIRGPGKTWYTDVETQFGGRHYVGYNFFVEDMLIPLGHVQVRLIEDGNTVFSICSTQHVGHKLMDFFSIPLTDLEKALIHAMFTSLFQHTIHVPPELVAIMLSYVSGPYIPNVEKYAENTWL